MYEILLPIRYLFKRRVTCLAVIAVALSVFIVVVVMTVMNGLVREFKNKNHDLVGDCVVSTESLVGFAYYQEFLEELRKQRFVYACSEVVKGFGLLTQQGAEWNIGVEITGIKPGEYSRATGFAKTLYYYKNEPEKAFLTNSSEKQVGCIIGIDMKPGGRNSLGQYEHSPLAPRFELIVSSLPLTAKGALANADIDIVNTKTFSYIDDSHSGIPKVDGKMVYLPFDYAQRLCGMAGATKRAGGIHIKFMEDISLQAGCGRVKQLWDSFYSRKQNELSTTRDKTYLNLLGNVTVQSWKQYRRESIAPMEKEQTMLILLFAMLGIITVFVVSVVFYMIISHKSKDIGILKSIGVSCYGIVRVFFIFASLVGLAGSAIGLLGGYFFLLRINRLEDWLFEKFNWQLWDRTVYAIGEIPNKVDIEVLTIIVFSAILASLAGAVIPVLNAARRRPAEILQVNQL